MRLRDIFKILIQVVGVFSMIFISLFFAKKWYNAAHENENQQYLIEKSSFFASKYWKYKNGDDTLWASTKFDDSRWDTINPELDPDIISENQFSGICWFRTSITIDSAYINKRLALRVIHLGASEIYLDGKKIQTLGTVSDNEELEKGYFSRHDPILFTLLTPGNHLISMRYSNNSFKSRYKHFRNEGKVFAGVTVTLSLYAEEKEAENNLQLFSFSLAILTGFFISLSIVHILLYIFFRQQKQNRLYSLFTLFFAIIFLLLYGTINTANPEMYLTCRHYFLFFGMMLFIPLVHFLHVHFTPPGYKVLQWIIRFILFITLFKYQFPFSYIPISFGTIFGIYVLFALIEIIRAVVWGLFQKLPGSQIIGAGVLIFTLSGLFFMLTWIIQGKWINEQIASLSPLVFFSLSAIAIVSIPLSMSIYLAYDFSLTSKNLSKKLVEVEDLSAKTISQEKEKQEILSQQKEKLEIQVVERTKEISKQKTIIEEKNKDIIDSITYAKRIQNDMLPSDEIIRNAFPDSFILYKPKDIVSGDFYWFAQKNEYTFLAAADCTGHGVPGAFMSVIGHNFLNQIVNEMGVTDTAEILNQLHKKVKTTLSKEQGKSTDGMDVGLLSVNHAEKKAQFSGAARPLFYFDKDGFHEVKREFWSIGGVIDFNTSFRSVTIPITSPTTFYLFSDGFVDQFSSEDKKLMTGKFKEILISIQNKSMEEQKQYLDSFIENWKGNMEQTDDILVIGIRM